MDKGLAKTVTGLLLRFSKREKAIFYAAILFVSVTVLDRLIIAPISSKLKSLEKEIQDSQSNIRKNLRLLNYRDKIHAERKKYESFLQSAGDPEEAVTSVLKEIENLANKSSVYLIELKPSGLKNEAGSKQYMITLTCEAQMEQLIDFMYGIEESDKLLSIEKYQISPKSKDSSLAKCSMTISYLVIV